MVTYKTTGTVNGLLAAFAEMVTLVSYRPSINPAGSIRTVSEAFVMPVVAFSDTKAAGVAAENCIGTDPEIVRTFGAGPCPDPRT